MIRIVLTLSLEPRDVQEEMIMLPEGACARDALQLSALMKRFSTVEWQDLVPGIWGQVAAWDQLLHDGDRVELCRPLLVDPKTARRERFVKQGARGTGLFAKRRAGGKAGY